MTPTPLARLKKQLLPPRAALRHPLTPERGAPDLTLLLLVLALALLGTLTVFSAGYAYASVRYGDPTFFIRRQSVWLLLGLLALYLGTRIRVETYRALTPLLYLLTLLLLVLVLIVGFVGNGAQRWISIGPLTLQPSEIAKLSIVMMLALYFDSMGEHATERRRRGPRLLYGTLLPLLILLVPVLLVMLQHHLSCIIILSLIGLCVIVAAGVDLRYIAGCAAIGGVGVTCLALFTGYTKERITVWRNPELYKLTGGWQTLQGLMAIGSGGLFGVGIGRSVLKYCYVSEPANDMIFAILCEETGLVGASAVLLLFTLLIGHGYRLAMRADTAFERLTVFGVCTKIAVQVLLNVGVVTNTIPNTGISLPFFSYGGSSLVMLLFEMGMLLSISRRTA